MENSSVFSGSPENLAENKGFLDTLITRAKQGQETAFGEIYELYFKKIYRFIYYRVGHKEAAEDLAEDVFIKAFRKVKDITNNASFEGWLYQIARNTVIDYYRDKRVTIALEEVENTLEYESNIVDVLNLQDDQKVLLKLIKNLTGDQQLVLKLKFFEELDNEQIAAMMKKTEGAVRVIQYRALQKLQELKDTLDQSHLEI